jgi:hypothetical protein
MASEAETKQFSALADCVIDAADDAVVMWHVNTGSDRAMSRMVGAWVVGVDDPSTIGALVGGRRVLATAEGEKALVGIGVSVRLHIDPVATIARISSECDALQAVYTAHPNSRTLVAPAWPTMPSVDGLHMETVPPDVPTNRALAMARWLERVAQCWDRVERERLARRYMPGGPGRRRTPVATSATRQQPSDRQGRGHS